MLREALRFLKTIDSSTSVTIASHHDADGVSSAAILDIFLKRHRGREADFISINTIPPTSLVKNLKTVISDRIILADLSIVDTPLMERIVRFAPTLLIDHHSYEYIPKIEGLVYYNPRRRNKEIYQSASYLSFKIARRIVDISDKIWIAVVGIVGDYDITYSKDLLSEAKKRFPEIRLRISDLLKTDFGKIANLIYAVKSHGRYPMADIVRLMEEFDSPSEFLNDQRVEKYIRIYEEVNKEIEKEMARTMTETERYGNIMFFELKSRFNITSIISSMVADRNRDMIVVIYERSANKVKISVRNQSKKYDLGMLIREAISQIPGASGGGHPAAGGGQVPASRWDEFKAALIRAVEASK